MTATRSVAGRCHCENVTFALETSIEPELLPLRACRCAFCRRHGARNTSDPRGRLAMTVRDSRALMRHRFALSMTDFVVCGRCGVYVAAMMAHDGAWLATVNVNAMDDLRPFAREATPMTYDGESTDARLARRLTVWTPTELVFADGSSQ